MAAEQAEQRRVRTEDGTEVAYYTLGAGPPVLVANALGADFGLWRYQLRYFADRYRFITWDYRGLFQSKLASGAVRVDMAAHAHDVLAVLRAEQIERVAVIGWSFGVSVAVELFASAPEQVACLVFVNGTAGGLPDAASLIGLSQRAWPWLLRMAAHTPVPFDRMLRRLVGAPEALAWARRIGLVGREDDEEALREAAIRLVKLDRRVLRRLLEAQLRYDGTPSLPSVDVPTLSLSGDRDQFVSRAAMETQAKRIPGAEFVVVPGAAHCLPTDSPQFMNLRLEKFFQERGYPSMGPEAGHRRLDFP